MNRWIGFALTIVVAGPLAHAQSATAAPPQTQQVETGFATIDGQAHVPYRIRLMPVSSFPQLPPVVARELDAKGCMIPQTYEAREPENVIHGSFEKKGSKDWAALCSIHGVSTLYVFFGSDLDHPIALRSQADTLWLGQELGEQYGSAWGILTHPASLFRPSEHADHDGIDDAFVEESKTIHYFRNGRWTTIEVEQ